MEGRIATCNLICGVGRFAFATAGLGQPRVTTIGDWIWGAKKWRPANCDIPGRFAGSEQSQFLWAPEGAGAK
jgi:hypothetical protein